MGSLRTEEGQNGISTNPFVKHFWREKRTGKVHSITWAPEKEKQSSRKGPRQWKDISWKRLLITSSLNAWQQPYQLHWWGNDTWTVDSQLSNPSTTFIRTWRGQVSKGKPRSIQMEGQDGKEKKYIRKENLSDEGILEFLEEKHN